MNENLILQAVNELETEKANLKKSEEAYLQQRAQVRSLERAVNIMLGKKAKKPKKKVIGDSQ